MRPINYFLNNPFQIIASAADKVKRFIPDRVYVKILFRSRMGYGLNLDNPQTYNEKLQWLKLYDRRHEYVDMVDKFSVKKYVSNIIGDKYIIPTLGVWDNVEDIEWEVLPQQFVLKCTHDSGGLVICHDKTKLNIEETCKKLKRCLKRNYYYANREWPYKEVKKRIIAEQYVEDEYGELRDYKFFCFGGEVKAMFVATERQKAGEEVKFDFFDTEFNHLPFIQGHPNACYMPRQPRKFEEMKQIAATLSKGLPHVRVDLYEVKDKVLFGEMTFFHFSGLVPFCPNDWDRIWGSYLELPPKTKTLG